MAQIQQQLRTAAMRRDWAAVDALILQAELEAGDNAWLKASLDSIKQYASTRDEARMSKEASYSSARMMSRMVSASETAVDYNLEDEAGKPMYLRRKLQQGKRMGPGR